MKYKKFHFCMIQSRYGIIAPCSYAMDIYCAYIYILYRNPELHERKAFPDIYKLLKSLDQQTLAEWSVEDRQTSLRAAILGAPLQEGMRLYPELQNKYIKE